MGQKLKNEALNRLSADEFKSAQKRPVVVVLDNVRSLHNVGSVFRTADAFLIEGVFLCGLTGTPPNKEIEKTALGATATVNWQHFSDTQSAILHLKENGYKIYAVEQAENSTMLDAIQKTNQKTAFVFGNEVYGVEQDIVDQCEGVLEIPQEGTKHSLNISVSVGIVLWEFLKRQ